MSMNRYKYIDNSEDKHLHTLDGGPLIGTSNVGKILFKPLTYWAAGLALEKFGWIKKKYPSGKNRPIKERLHHSSARREEISLLTDREYLKLLDEAYSAHRNVLDSSADSGKEMHAELERFVKYSMRKGSKKPFISRSDKILPFIQWANMNVKRFIVSEGHVFSERLWVGGITDCVAELNDGSIGIIDFKSHREGYQSDFLQCAGYSIQLKENGVFTKDGDRKLAPLKKIDFFAVVPFGSEEFRIDFRYNVSELESGFESMLKLYKLINNK
jgi:hypothetical protein